MAEADLPRDHWVSRGYQQNFASPDKRVAMFDVRAGRVVDVRRPIKSNFREQGFTTYLEAGVPNDLLERAFGSVEGRVLNEIRRISAARGGPQQRADVANVFALHLVRSPAFKAFHRHIGQRYRVNDVPLVAADPSVSGRFEASEGRPPAEGELLEISLRAYDEMVSDPMHLVTTMIRQHDAMADMLNRFHLQVVELAPGLPGFVLGDTPVVHAALGEGRYGFRDHLALGDADFVIGPLTRTTAACFTVRPLPPVRVTTRKKLDAINAIFLRAAQVEVACHPDDANATRQTHRGSTGFRRGSLPVGEDRCQIVGAVRRDTVVPYSSAVIPLGGQGGTGEASCCGGEVRPTPGAPLPGGRWSHRDDVRGD